jgi:hypothetical protein
VMRRSSSAERSCACVAGCDGREERGRGFLHSFDQWKFHSGSVAQMRRGCEELHSGRARDVVSRRMLKKLVHCGSSSGSLGKVSRSDDPAAEPALEEERENRWSDQSDWVEHNRRWRGMQGRTARSHKDRMKMHDTKQNMHRFSYGPDAGACNNKTRSQGCIRHRDVRNGMQRPCSAQPPRPAHPINLRSFTPSALPP